MSGFVLAQGGRPASPAGTAATRSAASTIRRRQSRRYQGGKWIEITYGRPIKRGRDCSAAPARTTARSLNPDAPVWRAGANNSTQLKTEVPLVINGKTVAPGTYTMFIDLKPNNWTLIVSNWEAQTDLRPEEQGRALRRVRLHAGQGRRPRADDARTRCRSRSIS